MFLHQSNSFLLAHSQLLFNEKKKKKDATQVQIQLCLQYKNNWQDHGWRWRNRSRFLHKVRETIVECGIMYSLPHRHVSMEGDFLPSAFLQTQPLSSKKGSDSMNTSTSTLIGARRSDAERRQMNQLFEASMTNDASPYARTSDADYVNDLNRQLNSSDEEGSNTTRRRRTVTTEERSVYPRPERLHAEQPIVRSFDGVNAVMLKED